MSELDKGTSTADFEPTREVSLNQGAISDSAEILASVNVPPAALPAAVPSEAVSHSAGNTSVKSDAPSVNKLDSAEDPEDKRVLENSEIHREVSTFAKEVTDLRTSLNEEFATATVDKKPLIMTTVLGQSSVAQSPIRRGEQDQSPAENKDMAVGRVVGVPLTPSEVSQAALNSLMLTGDEVPERSSGAESKPKDKKKKTRFRRKDAAMAHDLYEATLELNTGWAGWTLLSLTVILGVTIFWAAWAKVEEVTQAPGRVISSQKEQVIQSLEGGIISELLVKEGDLVVEGQPLLRIDDTKMGTAFRESQGRVDALIALSARLMAESSGKVPEFPKSLEKRRPELVKNERSTFLARRRSLEESLSYQKKLLSLAEDEAAITEPVVKQGLASNVELIRLQRQVAEIRGKIEEQKNRFKAEAFSEYSKVQNELESQSEVAVGREDSLRRTQIRAPKRGIVKNVRFSTIGGVIQPGQDILEIVPVEEVLLIEAKVRPSDVAFLRPGQQAVVKLTAYDFSIYGGLDAYLEYISPDTLRDEVRRDETYYKVQLRTTDKRLKNKNGEVLPIIPGMIASVEVKTGSKSILDYLLKPILKSRDAFRER